eukprot:747802-Hanusia_phi.AAC.1
MQESLTRAVAASSILRWKCCERITLVNRFFQTSCAGMHLLLRQTRNGHRFNLGRVMFSENGEMRYSGTTIIQLVGSGSRGIDR